MNDRQYYRFNPHLGYERLASEGTTSEQRKEVPQIESHKETGSNRSHATPPKASRQAIAPGKKAKKVEKLRLPLFLKIAVVFLLLIVVCLMTGIVIIALKLSKTDAELMGLKNLNLTTNGTIESTTNAQRHNESTTIKTVTEKLPRPQSITIVSNDTQQRKPLDTVILKKAQELPPTNAKTTREAMRFIREASIEKPKQKRGGILKIEEIPQKLVFIPREPMKITSEAPITVKDFKMTPERSRTNANKLMSFSRTTQAVKYRQPSIEIPKEKSVPIATNATEMRKPAYIVIPMEIKERKEILIPRESIRTTRRAPIEIAKRESGARDYSVLRKRDEIPKQSKTIPNHEEIFIPHESKSIVIPSNDAKHGKYIDIPRRFKRESPPSSEMRQISGAVEEKEREIKKFHAKRMTRNGNGEKHVDRHETEENERGGKVVLPSR